MSNSNTSSYDAWNRFVSDDEHNKLKLAYSESDSSGTTSSEDSDNESQVNTKKKLSFKNKLVMFLCEKFKRKCSIDDALDFFRKRGDISAEACDANFWNEILYCVNLNSITIQDVCNFKQNILKLIKIEKANKEKSIIMSVLSSVIYGFSSEQQPKEIKFGISPEMLKKLLDNEGKIFVDYLLDEDSKKCLDDFRIQFSACKYDSCEQLLDIVLSGLKDGEQDTKYVIGLLKVCSYLTGCGRLPVDANGWIKIFSKIKIMTFKEFGEIRKCLELRQLLGLKNMELIFAKIQPKSCTQENFSIFINAFEWSVALDNFKDIPNHILNIFLVNASDNSFDFELIQDFVEQKLCLKLSDIDKECLHALISKVKSSSINSNTFKALVELVKGKNIVLGTRNDVDELRQLLCDVLRISEPELDLSDVMDLFLLYPEMPKFCTKSTLTNESLKLALEEIKKISAVDSKNEKLSGNKDEFRIKLKEFIDLFEDVPNKITFDNFKNLILAVPNDYLDFECLDYVLQKTNIENYEVGLCKFFETDVLKKISKYKFDLKHVRDFFDKYLSGESVKDYKFKAETFGSIVDMIIQSNKDCSCNNKNIEWLLQECHDASVTLEKDKFVSLIKKGNVNKKGVKVEKIKWLCMYNFINKIVSPESGFFSNGKIEFDQSGISEIHQRSNFDFDNDNLSVFIDNILKLKKFVTGDQLFEITLNHIPYGGLKSLGVFKKVVYYCFENVENYNSDIQIPIDYCHKIDSKLYSELLKTFEDESLSYDDFKTLNSRFFSGQQSGNLVDFLFGLFSENKTNANVSNIDHTVLKKKLKKGTLFNQELNGVFSKFGDKKLPKNDFVEILMLAKDDTLTKNDFITLFQKYCKDKIETENSGDILNKIASKFSDASKEDLQACLVELNAEKGITQLLDDIKKDFSVLFKLTDQKLKEYGLSILLNQSDQGHDMQNNIPENVVNANYSQLNQNLNQELLNQNNEENDLNGMMQGVQDIAIGVVENLDEGKYGTRMSIIDFKTKYPNIWSNLDKEQRVYLQMILGYKQSLLLTIFCLSLNCVLFVPATTVTYCLGVFFIIYFLLKLTGERTKNRLTEMVQGKSRKSSFWDRLFVWNKCIEDAIAMCCTKKKSGNSNNDNYEEMKDSILNVMLPERVSFFNTASSCKNTVLRMVNRVSSVLDHNVLS